MIPSYVSDVMKSNKRRYVSRSPVFAVQDIQDQTYDAYEMDIGTWSFINDVTNVGGGFASKVNE